MCFNGNRVKQVSLSDDFRAFIEINYYVECVHQLIVWGEGWVHRNSGREKDTLEGEKERERDTQRGTDRDGV